MSNSYKKILTGTWLGRVYKADKVLFIILALFFVVTIGSNLVKLQTTPFFTWTMFSMKIPDRPTYSYYQIDYNDSEVLNLRHTWSEPLKSLLFDPLDTYIKVRNDHIDSFQLYLQSHWAVKHPALEGLTRGLYLTNADMAKYPGWLRTYLSSVTGRPIKTVCVLRKQMHFEADGKPAEVSSDTMLYIR